MDLHFLDEAPSEAERQAVDGVLGGPDGHVAAGGRAAREHRHLLLPALHAAQARAGWISPGTLGYICRRLTVPPAEAYGVASFYAMLSTVPRPPTVVHVCDDIVCRTKGAEDLVRELERGKSAAGADEAWTWRRSPCLGHCERGPAALLQRSGEDPRDVTLAPVSAPELVAAASSAADPPPAQWPVGVRASAPQAGEAGLRLLRRIGSVDPTRLDDYRAKGGYAALGRALEVGPEAVIGEVKDSRLLGRGGAAFPMGVKWESVARATARPHYVVCNADESEPGTFKDRLLLEQDPFALVEAITIAGYAAGAEHGYLYLRGEYPLALERMRGALAQARSHGFLGENVMDAGFRFDVEVRRGAGAYVCGEETALFSSIEGERGEPRNKPPFPVGRGVFGQPTVVNNVETLLNVLDIVLQGGRAFASIGTPGSTGSKLFCLSGCVERPGVYEMPFGTTLRRLLDLAGGVRGGRALRAVLLGGASGTFLRPDEIDVPLSFEGTREIGAALGSGAVIVFDDTVDLADIVLRIAAFFRDESCGRCAPCRVGTVRQEEALHRLATARLPAPRGTEVALLGEIARVMRDASICGLGQTAASAVQSAVTRLRLFDERGDA